MPKKKRAKYKPHIDYIEMANWPVNVGYTCSIRAFGTEMARLRVKYPDGVLSEGAAKGLRTQK